MIRLKKALDEEKQHPRGGVGKFSVTQLRKNYSDSAIEEMLKNRENSPEDHDGDEDPLDSGYSGPD